MKLGMVQVGIYSSLTTRRGLRVSWQVFDCPGVMPPLGTSNVVLSPTWRSALKWLLPGRFRMARTRLLCSAPNVATGLVDVVGLGWD